MPPASLGRVEVWRGGGITRPVIANERLKRNRAGQVVLQLKSPYRDGTTHIVMSPLEFLQRLAALVSLRAISATAGSSRPLCERNTSKRPADSRTETPCAIRCPRLRALAKAEQKFCQKCLRREVDSLP